MSIRAWWLLSITVITALGAIAQETRGQIAGRVVDPDGAVVALASVQASNTTTGFSVKTTTDSSGGFTIPLLPSASYVVAVEKAGFKRAVREEILVRVAENITLEISLEIGDVTETVLIVGETPLLETGTASLGQVIDHRRLTELPLKDGNPMMLASLAPGVLNLAAGGWTRPFDNNAPSSIAVSGSRTGQNEFTLDGAPNTQRANVAYIPPADVVQEFKIQTATFDASAGFSPGATVNVSLKSGTNQLHGTAYHFLQNPALNANSFFANRGGFPKPVIRLNRWGATVSGPVVIPRFYNGRNRTFFLHGYEGIHSTDPEGTFTTAVPTQAMRRGDLSSLLQAGGHYQIYDPATTTPVPGGRFSRQPFPGNLIPSSRISPAAATIMAYWPEPNLTGTADGSNNWTTPRPEWDRFYSHVFRIDHNLSAAHRIFFRGSINNRDNEYSVRFNRAVGAGFFRRNRGFVIDDVYTFSPNLLLNSRYSYTRFIEGNVPVNQGIDLTSLGFNETFRDRVAAVNPEGVKFPRIDVGGYGSFGPDTLSWRRNDIHDLALSLTRISGSHTVRLGGGYRVYRENLQSLGQSSGQIAFGSDWTRGPLDTSPSAPMGQTLASFLLGLPTGGGLDVNDSYAEQSRIATAWIQDDWKVTRRLLVTLALRYEVEPATTERYNRAVRQFDFATASPLEASARTAYANNPIAELPPEQFRAVGGLTFAGAGANPRSLWKTDANNLMPRIGVAYQAGEHTVLRLGYGLFFDLLGISRRHVIQSGFSHNTELVPTLDNGQSFIATLDNPFPRGVDRPLGAGLGLATFAGQNVSFYPTDAVNPYVQRWQLGIQRAVGRDAMVEATYVGNRGTSLPATRQLNAIPAEYLSSSPVRDQATINFLNTAVANPFYPNLPRTSLAGTTVPRSQLLRPYPHFSGISMPSSQGFSWYHSLQVRAEKRTAGGLMLLGSWTWSKLMDASSYLNEADPLPFRVISDQDRTHRLVMSGVWELPVGRGKRFGSSLRGLSNTIMGGWQLQAIYQLQTGPPLGFGNAIFFGSLSDIPLSSSSRSVDRWFNTGAGFERSPSRQLSGNRIGLSPRFSGIRGDGIKNWDISAFKSLLLRDSLRLQIRAEFVNAFNHAQFAAPNTTPSSTAFGQVTRESQWPRTIQFGLKLLY